MNSRAWFAVGVVLLATLACGVTGEAEPTARPLPPTPAFATAAPSVPVGAPPPAAAPGEGFRDDFNGTLGSGWQWLGEDATHWNLTSTPGHLRIIVQGTNISDEQPRNFLVREAPQGNFEIGTAVRFSPTSRFQFAGLLVYQEQRSALQFGPAYAPCTGGDEGQCVYVDSYQGGQLSEPNLATYIGAAAPAYLRLKRIGTTYTASYSADGSNWTEIGSKQSSITPRYVGLVAAQGDSGEVPADFDYFTLEQLP